MKNNAELQKDVQDALNWEPMLSAAEIGVTVKDGIVTLTGIVNNYTKKYEAEDAVKKVAGVKAVVEKIEVKFDFESPATSDSEIASEVLNAFRWNWKVPNDKVKVKVENGWITLEGEVEYLYEKEAATDCIRNLMGVAGVSNTITLRSRVTEAIEKAEIENALRRNWSIYDKDITVKVSGHKATLTGSVVSWYQRNEAGVIASNAPGVWSVQNDLIVDYDFAMMDI